MKNAKIAEYLLKIKAVAFRPEEPFTWASGWKSPIYCDNRKTLSYPEIRDVIRNAYVSLIRRDYPSATGIAGVATGAIAQAALVADALDLPMIYLRDKPKGHGMENLIEGDLHHDGRYVVIEDLISTGGSSARAVKAVQVAGAEVLGTVAIFSYGFAHADAAFAATGTPYQALTTLSELLETAIEIQYLSPDQEATILAWRMAPQDWRREPE